MDMTPQDHTLFRLWLLGWAVRNDWRLLAMDLMDWVGEARGDIHDLQLSTNAMRRDEVLGRETLASCGHDALRDWSLGRLYLVRMANS
ncbi:hypothetical protein IG631_24188 [Alternaria alternata]|nr:hypothetical protein IG631_24188 [Alternaria alternata]